MATAPSLLAQFASFNAALEEEEEGTDKKEPRSLDFRLKRVILRYKSEISFLMPEGEFNVSLGKKIGEFSSIAEAKYNFLRGEMAFSSTNIFTKFRIVPQFSVYDKLKFIPIFDDGKTWQREQGMMLGGRLLFKVPANTLTSIRYIRYSTPSESNLQSIKLQKATMISQTFGGEIDSVKAIGFVHGGIFELQFDKAFPLQKSDLEYAQMHLRSRGQAIHPYIAFEGEFNWTTLLEGKYAPPRYLGGRKKLSGYDHNEFSGLNLLLFQFNSTIILNRHRRHILRGLSFSNIAWRLYYDVGQVGDDDKMMNFSNYHHSLGTGFVIGNLFNDVHLWEFFISVHRAMESNRDLKFYFGIKI
ncbi:MAG: hypothetical protein DWQ05_03875 [Calditrichaeota bacterium]|nr:MAG: hypothetical protein DWQ05_03875 [Calditrichota bacterium]